MSDTKHTKGIWTLENGYIKGNGYNIASVNSCKSTEGQANACLIAAAPDLLVALEFTLSYDAPSEEMWHNFKILAKRAITKAKGQS